MSNYIICDRCDNEGEISVPTSSMQPVWEECNCVPFRARIEVLRGVLDKAGQIAFEELKGELDSKQAHIDQLMFEFTPDEMTEEQIKNWEDSQRPVDMTDVLSEILHLGSPVDEDEPDGK